MLAHPLCSHHFNSLIKISKRWNKYPTFYVSFLMVKHQFKIKEITRDISDNHASTFVIFKPFGYWEKLGRYSRYYMLDFPIFWVVTYAFYYVFMKDTSPTFYVSSSCFSQHFNSLIQMSWRWNKYPTFCVRFPLGNTDSKLNNFQEILQTIMLAPLLFFKYFGSQPPR